MVKPLTVGDVVRRLDGNVSTDAVRRAADRGELPVMRTPRSVRIFEECDVERWIAKRQNAAANEVLERASA